MTESPAPAWNPLRWPLPVRVLLGVVLGVALGAYFGPNEIALGWTNENLARLGGLYTVSYTHLTLPTNREV